MKTIRLLLVTFGLLLFAGACNCDSKADTWGQRPKKLRGLKKCMTFMEEKGTLKKRIAVDFCDCMLEKTSEKYTPEEAVNITEEEEAKTLGIM